MTNAYLAPILRALRQRRSTAISATLGAQYPVRYFQSNGGLAIGQAMTDRSVYAINSGPASAPQAGLYVAAPFEKKNVITVDMGGTSFDITLTKDGLTNLNKNIDFLRYRIGVPMIQVETLGAGGGSIGWIDAMGLLQVGPQSAGADPGPACYGRGGDGADGVRRQPRARLSQSRRAARRQAAARPGEGARRRSRQIADAARHLGRAGGLRHVHHRQQQHGQWHPARVGRARLRPARLRAGRARAAPRPRTSRRWPGEMGIDTVILPKLASGLCAFGQIISDVKYNYMATAPMRLDDDAAYERIDTLFKEIEKQGRARILRPTASSQGTIGIKRSLDMRYVGQVHECTVEIGNFEIDGEIDRAR